MTNVFGGETNDKTFNLHLIKALKDNECERVRIEKKERKKLDQRLHTEFRCGLVVIKNSSLWAFVRSQFLRILCKLQGLQNHSSEYYGGVSVFKCNLA